MAGRTKSVAASLFVSALLFAGLAAPADAQPIITGGLVNITIVDLIDGDVLSNNNVALVAATVCDVNVNVLAVQLKDGPTTCTTDAGDTRVDITQAQ